MAANGCCGRTFLELFPQTKEMTLDTFLDQWYKGMFLSLKTDGRTQESVSPKVETESWSGGCWTLNTLESLNDDVESSLYSILEHGGGTRRYCLSPKACEGILRRAKERGKVLPVKPVLWRDPFNTILEDFKFLPPIIKALVSNRDTIDHALLKTGLLFVGDPRRPLIHILQRRINQLTDRCDFGSQFQRRFASNRKDSSVPDKSG